MIELPFYVPIPGPTTIGLLVLGSLLLLRKHLSCAKTNLKLEIPNFTDRFWNFAL